MLPARSASTAIPSNLIKGVIPKLLSDGRLVRPWLGVQGQLVPPILKDLLRIPLTEGFLVEAVEPGSPAEKAGLMDGEFELSLDGEPILLGGDIITEMNGIKLEDIDKLEQALRSLKIGSKLPLAVFRKDKRVSFDIAIIERPLMPWDLPNRKTGWPSSAYPQNERAAQSHRGKAIRQRVIF